jgi:hypothetical protein
MARRVYHPAYNMSIARAKALNRILFVDAPDLKGLNPQPIVEKWVQIGLVGPRTRGKKGKFPIKRTLAGKQRAQVVKLSRISSFGRLPTPEKIKYAAAIVFDILHDLRLAKQEEHLVNWISAPKKLRKTNPYQGIPSISQEHVRVALGNMARSWGVRKRMLVLGLKHKNRPGDTFTPAEVRRHNYQRNLRAAAKVALGLWNRQPDFRSYIWEESRKIWAEALALQREFPPHLQWEKHG